ncbi:hypothetical protein ACGFOU_29250 [Streptomyces sp. NPDC048595]|uniref:hypothetical protein n=1 Tax=Streptomyces sp. NPDC048595 TaxID=3365576 RepID=UPI0037243EBA
MKHSTAAAGTATALVFSVAGVAQFAPSASAASPSTTALASKRLACSFSGATGSAVVHQWGPGYPTGGKKRVTLKAKDKSADGRHVGIRLYTKHANGSWKPWKWHLDRSGKGAAKTWHTSVLDYQGISGVKVRVATFKGDKVAKSCTKTIDPTG